MTIPKSNYGISEYNKVISDIDKKIEDVFINGFTVLSDCFKESEIEEISKSFDDRLGFVLTHTLSRLWG